MKLKIKSRTGIAVYTVNMDVDPPKCNCMATLYRRRELCWHARRGLEMVRDMNLVGVE